MDIISVIIQLVSGAAGANIIGTLLKNFSLGPLWNSVVGILGGGLGGPILELLGAEGISGAGAASALDIGSILFSMVAGGVGGGILMVIVGLRRLFMGRAS